MVNRRYFGFAYLGVHCGAANQWLALYLLGIPGAYRESTSINRRFIAGCAMVYNRLGCRLPARCRGKSGGPCPSAVSDRATHACTVWLYSALRICGAFLDLLIIGALVRYAQQAIALQDHGGSKLARSPYFPVRVNPGHARCPHVEIWGA